MVKPLVILDTESLGGGSFGKLQYLYCFSYSYKDSNTEELISCALPLMWNTSTQLQPQYEDNLAALRHICENSTVVFHNAAHDLDVLAQVGIEVTDWEDTMLMSYAAYPGREEISVKGQGLSRHSLGAWGERLGDSKMKTVVKWDKYHPILAGICDNPEDPEAPRVIEELLEYAKQDAALTYSVLQTVIGELHSDPKASGTYRNIDHPYVSIIREMTSNGMYVDRERLKELQVLWGGELERAVADARAIAVPVPQSTKTYVKEQVETDTLKFVGMQEDTKNPGRMKFAYQVFGEYNPNSGDQTAWLLSKLYGWEPTKLTDSGKPSVDAEVLSKLDYPLCELLSRIADYNKLVGTYAIPMGETADKNDGYIYPSWNQAITVTRRLSCSEPNFQNIPARTEKGKELRKSVIAPPGYLLCGIDLQAIEYRVLASLMADFYLKTEGAIPDDVQFMVDTFNNGDDIHTAMAKLWFGCKPDYEERAKYYRTIGKNVSYGRMFGFGADKAASMMGVSKAQAQEMIDTADRSNPSFPAFREAMWNEYKNNNGVAYNLYGGRYEYPDILLPEKGRDKWKLYRAQRQAFNAKVQGTAAEILKLLQLYCWNNICPQYGAVQIASVHDETLYTVPEENADAFCADVTKHYKNNPGYMPVVYIDGECNKGRNWYELK